MNINPTAEVGETPSANLIPDVPTPSPPNQTNQPGALPSTIKFLVATALLLLTESKIEPHKS